MGTLPDWVMDKPVLLTAGGRLARTPRTSPQVNGTHTRVWMELMIDGGVVGRSVVHMRGPEEVDWRAWQHDSIGTRQEDLVRSGRRQLSWPLGDNYPGRWRRGAVVADSWLLFLSLDSFSISWCLAVVKSRTPQGLSTGSSCGQVTCPPLPRL